MKRGWVLPTLLIVLVTCISALLVVVGGHLRLRPQPLTDEEAISQEFWSIRAEANRRLQAYNQRDEVLVIDIEGEWAVLEFAGVYLDTGEPVPAGPGIMIFKKIRGRWHGAQGGTDLYREWLDQIPESLISAEDKEWFR